MYGLNTLVGLYGIAQGNTPVNSRATKGEKGFSILVGSFVVIPLLLLALGII